MNINDEMRRLRGEHEELGNLAQQLMHFVEAPAPPPAAELNPVRTGLRNQLIAHLKREDWVLYPALIASEDDHVAAMARDFVAEMGGIAEAFSDYSRKWMPEAIVADWDAYCAETTVILTILGTRIARENRDLYPLAENRADVEAQAFVPERARAAR